MIDAEETVGFGLKRTQHEQAAHERRNWVRLTFDCNDRCVFCLDADTHDGRMRPREEVKSQILEGRRGGAERLILSGGEPTIHPDFVDFVRLGRAAGYRKIQTVTNGRMFAYREFLTRAVDAGLGEITFSIHGPDAKVHDALVGVRGAFDEEIAGLEHALADGRPIVNIDICVNRANVRHLSRMFERFTAMGVREFDLLQVIPFGRAYREGKDTLFYDLEQAREHLLAAFAWARKPDMHVWLNRFPIEHLEGFEELIQDPYKLNDEVRGRKEEYERWLDDGIPLSCREPDRCRHCYVRRLCDDLDEVRAATVANLFDVVRIDTTWEAALPPAFGGDPASAEKVRAMRHLPVLGASAPAPTVRAMPLGERVALAGARTAWIVAPDVAAAAAALAEVPSVSRVALELGTLDGLEARLVDGRFEGRTLSRIHTRGVAMTERALALPGDVEVLAAIDRSLAAWLVGLSVWPSKLALLQPSYDLASDATANDVDLVALVASLADVPGFADAAIEGAPACLLGRAPRPSPTVLDSTMLAPGAGLEIFRYTRRFVQSRDRVKSLRCRECAAFDACPGVHVNWVRAHGLGRLTPL